MRKHFLMTTLVTVFILICFLSCKKNQTSSKIGPLYLIEVMPTALNVEIDSTYHFSAIGRDVKMNVIEGISFTWTSRYPAVGIVNQNGLFTALSSGTTFLTAKSGKVVSVQLTVSVYDPVFSIEIQQDSLTVWIDSTTAQFTAMGKDMNGNDVTGLSFTWETGNTNIATIDNQGVITGVSIGNTTVTAGLRDNESLPVMINVRPVIPRLSTADVVNISFFIAQCGGKIISDGGSDITSRGVCWSTSQNPTISNATTYDGTGTGNFTSLLFGLAQETTYYIRAYATNSTGTGYGDSKSFTTETYIPEYGTMEDIDGNVYATVKIGNQWWMAENLKVTHYLNGDVIPHVTDGTEWYNLTTGAYCEYDNSSDNAATYGRLYNWYAVDDSRKLAPQGWHVPTDAEWKELEMALGMSQSQADVEGYRGSNEGSKLAGRADLWTDGNLENNAEFGTSGFAALPGGYRNYVGYFYIKGNDANFWSSTGYGSNFAWCRELGINSSVVYRLYTNKQTGFSVRCVRD